MALANTGTLQTNFNVDPYYDDYNQNKNFNRLLFKPGLAVQARELTQLQTILQNQIDRFGEHIFKEGSIVRGNELAYDNVVPYVKILNDDTTSISVDVTNFKNLTITGGTTGVTAYVVDVITGDENNLPDAKTLYLKYTNSGTDNITKTFADDEILTATTGGFTATTLPASSTGVGSIVTLGEGIIFAKDHFIRVDKQSVVVGKYTVDVDISVGYEINETITAFTDDNTLLDPAQGAYNYAAPGADRLQLTATIATRELTDAATNNFIERIRIKVGLIQEKMENPEYNVINDYIARRTYDESGDYLVNGLTVKTIEHLRENGNGGLYTGAEGGNTEWLSTQVTPGKAYVSGYETTILATQNIVVDKGIDTVSIEDASLSANYGNYVQVNEVVGSWDLDAHAVVNLYDTASGAVSNNTFGSTSVLGSVIGTARVRAIDHVTGAKGAASTSYNLYIYDIQMTTGAFSAVKTVHYVTGGAFADPILVNSVAVLKDAAFNVALVKVPGSFTKDLLTSIATTDTDWFAVKTYTSTVPTTGIITLDTSTGGYANELLAHSSTPSETLRAQLYHAVVSSGTAVAVTVADSGTAMDAAGAVTGVTSALTTKYNVGDLIEFSSSPASYFSITSIDSAITLTVANPTGTTRSGDIKKVFSPGQVISLNGNGVGGARAANQTTSKIVTFDLNEGVLGNTFTVDIIAEVKVENTSSATKTLSVGDKYIKLDISSNAAGVTGPWCLGVPDGYTLKEVRYQNADFTGASSNIAGIDVTSDFELDSGMRDNHYALAELKLKSTSNRVIGAADFYLVKFEYFTHSAFDSYLSVDSYDTAAIGYENIPIYTSPVNGNRYDLRNYVDFRPVRVASATPIADVAGDVDTVPTNPPNTSTTMYSTIRFIAPNETMTTSFNYYLGRKDRVIMNSKGSLTSLRGIPSLNPQTPAAPVDGLTLAIVDIAPFPSLPNLNATQINRLDLSNKVKPIRQVRYTMKDIGVLANRIENLEYYTTLSLLENSAKSLSITDANGLNRFKNGIMVDQFTSHTGDVNNLDYAIGVKRKAHELVPRTQAQDQALVYNSGTSTNIIKTGSMLMLPYTHTQLITQPYASQNKSLTSFFYSYKGELVLEPNNDYWISMTTAPDTNLVLPNNNQAITVLADQFQALGGEVSDSVYSQTEVRQQTTNADGSITITDTTTGTTDTLTTVTDYDVSYGELEVTQSGAEFLQSSEVITYMREKEINFSVTGLKPSTKVYAFFDNVDVSAYCTPSDGSYAGGGTTGVFAATGLEGADLITDANGNVQGIWRITDGANDSPGPFYASQQLIFKLTDSLTNSGNATTFAAATYVANGTSQTKGKTTFSSKTLELDISKTSSSVMTQDITSAVRTTTIPAPTVSINITNINNVTNINDEWEADEGGGDSNDPDPDPIAQTFHVDLYVPTSGAFLTKVDLFFYSKDDNLPVTVEIREVDSGGQSITPNILPFSKTIVPAASINASTTDTTLVTQIEFNSPVYLKNKTEYAIVIKPGGNNPNTSLWISKLADNDLETGNRIVKQPYSGVLFASANDKIYTPIQDEDIKFNMYFADFGQNQSGTVKLNNNDVDILSIANTVGAPIAQYGESVHGETTLVLAADLASGTVGDVIVDNTTGANGVITSTDNAGTYTLKDVTTALKFTNTDTVELYNPAASGTTSTITSQSTPIAKVKSYIDTTSATTNKTLILNDSDGTFAADMWVRGQITGGDAKIVSIDDLSIDKINTFFSTITLQNTFISGEYKFANATGSAVLETAYNNLPLNDMLFLDNRKYITSKSNEVAELASAKSVDISILLKNSSNPYVSPILDIERMAVIGTENIINNDSTDEAASSGGNAVARYITKIITLADDQDAEDLKVHLTAYNPAWADIQVYHKILNGEDGDTMLVRPWKLMTRVTNANVISDSENKFDFRELEYDIADAEMIGGATAPDGAVQYTNSAAVDYIGFKRFAIKIVLLSSNPSKPPRVKDMRVIALQL